MNGNHNNIEEDVKTEDSGNRKEDMSGESNINKNFDAMLEYVKNNSKTTKSLKVLKYVAAILIYIP